MKLCSELLLGEVDGVICLPYNEVAGSSDISRLISAGTWLYNLSSSADITATRLLAVGISRGVPVEYTKEQQLYRNLAPSGHTLLTSCIRIGTFNCFRVSGLV